MPKVVLSKQREYQNAALSRPDHFMWYDYPRLIESSRAAAAALVNAPVETVVFLSNTTEGLSTVLRNLEWEGGDVILHFSTVYDLTKKAIDFTVDQQGGKVTIWGIEIEYPVEDEEVIRRFEDAARAVRDSGKNPRLCVFELVSSQPAGLFPWVALVRACRQLGILSMVDGAQGVGMVKLNLAATDPDFLVSSCHKWLFVPHSCAVFYVPARNQHHLPSPLATSRGYSSKSQREPAASSFDAKSYFARNFEFTGTRDASAWLAVKDALAYREAVLGGEERIMQYLVRLNKAGGQQIAERLGTFVLDNSKGTMTDCALCNVALPLWLDARGAGAKESDVVLPVEALDRAMGWIFKLLMEQYKTSMPPFILGKRFFLRVSAQVYLDLKDYDFAAVIAEDIVRGIRDKRYLEDSRL